MTATDIRLMIGRTKNKIRPVHLARRPAPHGLQGVGRPEHNPNVLVCVHGVTRVGDDFDNLARALSDHYRVVCPDVVGRGRSGSLRNPQLYRIPQYVSDMVTLVARVTADRDGASVDWFGTSMGGLIGMALASLPGNPIRKLVLNDIGPTPRPGRAAAHRRLHRPGPALPGLRRRRASFVREVSLSFGEHTDDQWHKLAGDVLRQDDDGQWVRHYDMGLAAAVPRDARPRRAKADEARAVGRLRCDPLPDAAGARRRLRPAVARDGAGDDRGAARRPQLVEIPNVGHAPTFLHDDQIAIARQFLIG